MPSPYNRLGTFHRDSPGDLESSGKARLMSEWRDKRCREYKQPHTVLYALPVLREVAAGRRPRGLVGLETCGCDSRGNRITTSSRAAPRDGTREAVTTSVATAS